MPTPVPKRAMPGSAEDKKEPPQEPEDEYDPDEEERKRKENADTLHGTSDFSPEVTKLLKGWKTPFFGPGCNRTLEQSNILIRGTKDDDGRGDVTWKELHDAGYGQVAHGKRLVGDILNRDREQWEHQKYVKLRDKDGTEHAVFFYVDEPNGWQYEDLLIGGMMQINSPRLHRFMDGQDGMRLDESKQMGRIWKEGLTDFKRLDYCEHQKRNGNQKIKEEKYEDAIEFYELGMKIITGSSWDDPEQKKQALDLELQTELNIAYSCIMIKNYIAADIHAHRALGLRPHSAKAYLRLGQAALARGDNTKAVEALEQALKYAPEDPMVSDKLVRQELSKARNERTAQKTALKGMYTGFLDKKEGEFGAKKSTQALSGGLPEMRTMYNFRDLGGRKIEDGRKIKKKLLYRSSAPGSSSIDDMETLKDDYGVKTVIDLRTDAQRRVAPKKKAAMFAKIFHPVEVVFKGETTVLRVEQVKDVPKMKREETLKGTIEMHIDICGSLFWDMLTFWTKVWCIILLLLFQKEKARKITMQNSLGELGQVGFFQKVLDERGDEIKAVLNVIADPTNLPAVISCSDGKDLTALVCIIILGVVGASDQDIEEDYLASDRGIGDARRKAMYKALDKQGLDPGLAIVTRRTLRDTLDFIREREWTDNGGGYEAYCDYIGFDAEARARLCETLLPAMKEREDHRVIREKTDQEALRRRRDFDKHRPY